jgi:hypothetical protein
MRLVYRASEKRIEKLENGEYGERIRRIKVA